MRLNNHDLNQKEYIYNEAVKHDLKNKIIEKNKLDNK